MIINEHRSSKHLLRALTNIQPVFTGLAAQGQEHILSWPAAMAQQIANFAPHLLEKDTLRIVVAGAEQEGTFPSAFQLLNRLLGTSLQFEIHIIGPGLQYSLQPVQMHSKYLDSAITTHLSKRLLGDWIDENGMPDMIALNQPGFDSNYLGWLEEDDGIHVAIDAGVPVCGASYGYDEYVLDDRYLNQYGLRIEKHMTNHLTPRAVPAPGMYVPPLARNSMDRGEMDALRTLWIISNQIIAPTDEGVEDFQQGANLIEKGLNALIELGIIPDDVIQREGNFNPLVFYPFLVQPNYVHVMGPLVYDFTSNSIYSINDATKRPVVEGLDLSAYKGKLNHFYQVASFLLMIHKDHLSNLTAEIEDVLDEQSYEIVEYIYELEFEDDDDEDFLCELRDLFVQNMEEEILEDPEYLGGAELDDIETLMEYQSNIRKEILNMPLDEIYANDQKADISIGGIASMHNDLELTKILHKKGYAFNVRGPINNHCVLEYCATTGSNDVLRYLLENSLVTDLINSSDGQYTPLHYAAMSNNRGAYDLLLSHGASGQAISMDEHGHTAEFIMSHFE